MAEEHGSQSHPTKTAIADLFPITDGVSKSDGELLRLFVTSQSDVAFSQLASRYARLVYSTCIRETGERTSAEDASQAVFLLLSKQANTLQNRTCIAGWLFTTARFMGKNMAKQERRRKMYEADAIAETLQTKSQDGDTNLLWDAIEPHIHVAFGRLKPSESEAVLLRFMADQSFAEVGSSLGITENSARMRVSRAIEKVRGHLSRAGIVVSSATLALLLLAHAAHALPPGLLSKLENPLPSVSSSTPITPFSSIVSKARHVIGQWYTLISLGVIAIMFLSGYLFYQKHRFQPIGRAERTRLYARLVGKWEGNLEYADDQDKTLHRYPASLVFQTVQKGADLLFTARYKGSSAVDTTTFHADSSSPQGSDRITVTNGGRASSHTLNGIGAIYRAQDGSYAYEGVSASANTYVRLLIVPDGDHLMIQEEYRKPSQNSYQFRNRFTLTRP